VTQSFTAKDAKDAKEKKSCTAKDAKEIIIRTKPQGREDNAKGVRGSVLDGLLPKVVCMHHACALMAPA